MSEQGRPLILIVDDAVELRRLMAAALRRRFPEIEVMEAGSVAQGCQSALAFRPRLVLLDLSLGDGSGLVLARRIRDELPDTVVCICTLHDEPEFRQAAADSGAAWFVAKQGDFWTDAEDVVGAVLGEGERRLAGTSARIAAT